MQRITLSCVICLGADLDGRPVFSHCSWKHAFPDGRTGAIVVHCEFHGPNWILSVTDDGIGMPRDPAQVRVGLGTSIVQALAAQLLATIETEPAHPGTRVVVAHTQIALVDDVAAVAEQKAAKRPAA
jgi:two-component system, sensor histidine kinase PdtaS